MAQKSPSQSGKSELETKLRTEQKKLELVQEIGQALSSGMGLDRLLMLIMEKVTVLMEADRATLYLVTEDGKELWSKVTQGGEIFEIRLKVGDGIAGWVAESSETVNIPDAYTDNRFQPRVDLESGYRTRSILCVPMRASAGDTIGVMQVLNKVDGPFTAEDEDLLLALSGQAAVSIENSKLYLSVVEARDSLQKRTNELNLLYEVERDITAAHDLDELLERLLQRTMVQVSAEAGSIALVEPETDELRFRMTAGPAAETMLNKTIQMGEGVIGWVAKNRKSIVVNEPTKDERHATTFAETLGVRPRHLMAAPLVAHDVVVGAIELIDKEGSDSGFSNLDLQLLTLIAGQASRAIQIARAKEERENQDRLASIGSMLAGVLHDLKTPMTIISGYAQLMAQIEDSGQREQYVDQILRQFDLMSGMTREVLAFARGESNVLVRKVYLHKFLEVVETQLEHALAGREQKIELAMESEYTGVAYFDERSMLRLIHNLARNAADAMPRGGQFSIATRADDDWVRFEFSDTGEGIPAELEGRLFEMFSTRKDGGTGLGLAIVKKIVDDHNGYISYESEHGKGTTFRVLIPRERPVGVPEKTGEMPLIRNR